MRLWIAKQRYLIDFTLASLARRKTKNIGLVLVFSLLVFALASVTLLTCLLYTSPSPRDRTRSRMPSSA